MNDSAIEILRRILHALVRPKFCFHCSKEAVVRSSRIVQSVVLSDAIHDVISSIGVFAVGANFLLVQHTKKVAKVLSPDETYHMGITHFPEAAPTLLHVSHALFYIQPPYADAPPPFFPLCVYRPRVINLPIPLLFPLPPFPPPSL